MIFEMASCGGCRTCEMACSFKHAGEFVPAISSIKILACDGCTDLDVPWCVQYCEKAEDLTTIIRQFMENKKE